MTEQKTESSSRMIPGGSRQGCGLIALIVLMATWILGGIVAVQAIGWVTEQSIMDESLLFPDFRWVLIVGFVLMVGVPLLIATASISIPRMKIIFRTWTMAAMFTLFMLPSRLVVLNSADLISFMRLGGMCLYLLLFWRWIKPEKGNGWSGTGLALIVGAVGLIPWIRWGALGSFSDILLNGMVAILFGVCTGLTIQTSLYWVIQKSDRPYGIVDVIVDGLVAVLALLMMVTGLGQIGTQWMLAAALPILGLAGAAISYMGMYSKSKSQNWLAVSTLFALGTAGPLMWVDADELGLIFTGSAGELIEFVGKAASQNFLLGISTIILAILIWRYARHLQQTWLNWSGVGIVVIGLIVFQLVGGQPGLNGDHWFVILKDQADLSSMVNQDDVLDRRESVFETLVTHSNETQADLRSVLDRWNISYKPYYLVNALDVTGGPIIRLWLETRPEVDRIIQSPRLRPLAKKIPTASGREAPPDEILWNQTMIRVDQVWKDFNIRGAGILIGQPDSGVQGDHPEIADGYRGEGGDGWYDPWYGTTYPTDTGGHGTHTLATILGNRVGVAPDAEWIGCVNLARNMGNPAYYLDCWQFLFAPFPTGGDPLVNGNPLRGANIFNNSWGCAQMEGCDPNTFLTAVEALKTAGVFVVVSAGNYGYKGCGSISDPPAIYEDVVTVGAIFQSGSLTNFSSLGPVTVDGSERIKPDLVAPGEDILSAFPGSTYEYAAGTSMAGPHVVGVVALMWSANPDLIGNVDRTRDILFETAQPYQGLLSDCVTSYKVPNNAVGYGIVDAYAAVEKALELK